MNKTGGRKAGVPNKLTAGARHAVFDVFDQIGGVTNMAAWAAENQTDFYKLWGKTIPQNLQAEVLGKLTVQIIKYSDSNTPSE